MRVIMTLNQKKKQLQGIRRRRARWYALVREKLLAVVTSQLKKCRRLPKLPPQFQYGFHMAALSRKENRIVSTSVPADSVVVQPMFRHIDAVAALAQLHCPFLLSDCNPVSSIKAPIDSTVDCMDSGFIRTTIAQRTTPPSKD